MNIITAKPQSVNFDIKDFTDYLTKGKKGKYECPVCNEAKLSINRMTGKYNCYGCHDTQGIADKLRELAGENEDRDNNSQSDRQTTKTAYYIAERHYKEFEASAIPTVWADLNFRTVDDSKEIAEFLGWKAYKHTPGWTATGIDPATGASTGLGQFKPDEILTFPDGTEAKYLSQKAGYEVMCPKIPGDGARTYWGDIANDGTVAIRLTEGIKKAIASMVHTEMPTIAGCGVEMFLKDGQLTPVLQQFVQPDRLFEIAFDSDIVSKPEVRKALLRLAKVLMDAGCQVVVRIWEEKYGKGIDDVIFNGHNFDEVSESLSLREVAEKWERQFPDKTTNRKDKSPPKQSVFVNSLVEKYRERLAYNPELKIWLHYSAETEGIWAQEHDVFICRMLKNEVDVAYPDGCNASYIEGALKALKWELVVRKWNETPGLLPLQNGVLRLSDKKLLKPSPKYHLTWCLPYSYEPAATCQPIVDWFKEMVGEEDQIELLRCYLAAIVRGKSELHRFIELIGPGGTGKSTFTNLAIALVGANNTHSTTLKKIEDSRFEVANLMGKRLGVFNECDKYGGDLSTLKALTGSDLLPYEVKGRQSKNGFYFEGLPILVSNEQIQSSDRTSGLGRRRISMRFTKQIPNSQQRNLISVGSRGVTGDWVDFLPGLLNWVLGVSERTINNYLKRTEEFCPSLQSDKINSLLSCNSIADWADQHLVVRAGHQAQIGTAKEDKDRTNGDKYLNNKEWLYASYAEYCAGNGSHKEKSTNFKHSLVDLLVNQLGIDVKEGRNSKFRYIEGIALRDFDIDTDPLLISGNDDEPTDPPPSNPPSGPSGPPPSPPLPDGPLPGSSSEEVTAVTDSVTAKVTAETTGSAERDGLDGKNALLPAETQQPEKQPQIEEAISESQPTVEEVAQDLLACESSERLTVLRECYDRQTLQSAAKLLNSQGNKEKVKQIEAWVKQSGLTGDDWEVYQETGFTPEELAEIERQALESDNPETQQPETAKGKLKPGDFIQFFSSEGLANGFVEYVDNSKGEYWVKVGQKETKTVKVPFAKVRE
jgi:putative DNA primase/helicase